MIYKKMKKKKNWKKRMINWRKWNNNDGEGKMGDKEREKRVKEGHQKIEMSKNWVTE